MVGKSRLSYSGCARDGKGMGRFGSLATENLARTPRSFAMGPSGGERGKDGATGGRADLVRAARRQPDSELLTAAAMASAATERRASSVSEREKREGDQQDGVWGRSR